MTTVFVKRALEVEVDELDVVTESTYDDRAELRVLLRNFSEGLFDGTIPEQINHFQQYELDFTPDEWVNIRINTVSSFQLTKMLWQKVYDFHSEVDFDNWFRTWPIEVRNYAVSVCMWEHFRNFTWSFNMLMMKAMLFLMKHPRYCISCLVTGTRKSREYMRLWGQPIWVERRGKSLYKHGTHIGAYLREWRYMSQVEPDGYAFQSIYYTPEVVPTLTFYEQLRETLGIERFKGWGNVILGSLGLNARFEVRPRVDMQSLCEPLPVSLTSRDKAKIVNMCKTFLNMMERHQDKMFKLCKVGRFALALGDWDKLLFVRQRRVVVSAIDSFRFGLRSLPAFMDWSGRKRLPRNYADESTFVKCKFDKKIRKMSKSDADCIKHFRHCISLINSFDESWRNCEFREDRCRFYVEPQADESPAVSDKPVSAAPKADSKTSATAKPGGKKSYKNVKKGKVSGTVKKKKPDVAVAGEQKKTLVLADSRSVQKEKVKKVVSEKKPESNKEVNNDMNTIFSRPMMIARYDWEPASGTSELASFILPQAYFTQADKKAQKVCQPLTVNHMMSQYGYTRFDMNVRIQINSNKFQSGLLLVWWEPFLMKERDGIIPWATKTNFPHTWINASSSNSTEMIIPWQNHRDYFPIYCDSHSEYNYWGRLHIEPFSAIAAGEKTSTNATVTVYMYMSNWELHQQVNPKPVETISFASEIMPDDYPRAHIGDLMYPSAKERLVGKYVVVTPQMEEMATMVLTGMGQQLTEKLAEHMSRVSADKPMTPAPAPKAKLEVMASTAAGDGPDVTTSLSLTSTRVTPMRKKFLDTVAPVNLRELISMESWLRSFTISTSDVEGTSLGFLTVCPGMQQIGPKLSLRVTGGGEQYDEHSDEAGKFAWGWENKVIAKDLSFCESKPTQLAYLSNGFLWWCGGISYHVIAVKTDMHTCRIGIRYEPSGNTQSATTECQKVSTPGIVWDLSEDKELRFTAEYAAPQPFLSTAYRANTFRSDTPNVVGNYACGVVEFYVINPLKVSTGVSSRIDLHIFVSGAPDFEFSGLSSMSSLFCIGKHVLKDAVTQDLTDYWRIHYGAYLLDYLTVIMPNSAKSRDRENGDLAIVAYYAPTPFTEVGVDEVKVTSRNEMLINVETSLNTAAGNQVAILKLLGYEAEKLHSIVEQEVWFEESARTWDDAANFLTSHHVDIPQLIVDVLEPREIATMKKWMVVAHMRHFAFELNEIPSYFNFIYAVIHPKQPNIFGWGDFLLSKLRPKVTAQAEEEDVIDNKPSTTTGINPFKDGTHCDSASVKEMNGEDFNDMYKILRRYYPIKSIVVPPYTNSPLDQQSANEALIAQMNEREYYTYYWAFGIPVHPFQKFEPYGTHDVLGAAGYDNKFFSVGDLAVMNGYDVGHDTTYAHSHLFCYNFTYWRGELRYKVFIPGEQEVYGFVVHRPMDYGTSSVGLVSEAQLRRSMNYGTVMYKGNVMGGFEFEVPWQQKYARLLLSEVKRSAMTDNGMVYIYIPVRRSKPQFRPWPEDDVNKITAERNIIKTKLMVFQSFGDNTELLIPRGAPVVNYWWWFANNTADDNWKEGPRDIPESAGKSLQRGVPLYNHDLTLGVVQKNVVSYVDTDSTTRPWIRTDETLNEWTKMQEVYHRPSVNLETSKAERETMKRIINSRSIVIVKPQGVEEEAGPSKFANFEEFNAAFLEKGVDHVDFNTSVASLLYSVEKLPIVLDSVNKNLSRAQQTWKLTDAALSAWGAVTNKVGEASETVKTVGGFAYDAGRIGIIMYAFYSLLQAQDWPTRMMAITSGALALGLSLDVVRNAGEWLMANIHALFSSPKENETVEIQSEDEQTSCWEMLAEHIDAFKMFAAGVGAVAMFYMTKGGPSVGETSKFASSMITKLRNFSIVGNAVKTFDWLFKWISHCIEAAFTWACDLTTGGMLTKKILVDRCPEMLEWLIGIEKFNDDGQLMSAIWNNEDKTAFWKLFDKGSELTNTISEKNNFLAQSLSRGMTKLVNLENRMMSMKCYAPCRVDPFCIWIEGDSGVGKSAAVSMISSYIADHMGWAKHNRIYSRNEKDEYWSGYIGQPIVVIDDICQMTESFAVDDMIKVKTNVELLLKMSESLEKGRRFSSQMVVCTSNHLYPKPESMTLFKALWRRRNILARAYLPNGVAQGDYTKLRFKLFHPCPKVVDVNAPYADMNFTEFLAMSFLATRAHLSAQKAMIFASLEGQTIFSQENEAEDAWQEYLDATLNVIVQVYEANPSFLCMPVHIRAQLEAFTKREWNYFIEQYPRVGVYYREIITALERKKFVDAQGELEDLQANAETMIGERQSISREYMFWEQRFVSNRPIGKMHRFVDDEELKRTIAQLHPDAENKEELFNHLKAVFENFKSRKPASNTNVTGFLSNVKYKKYFKEEEGKWSCTLSEDDLDGEENEDFDEKFEIIGWWLDLKEKCSEDEIQAIFRAAFGEKEVVQSAPLRLVRSWGEKSRSAVYGFFERHPHITKILKLASVIAGLFGAYKLLKYTCGDWVSKVEEKLRSWLGMVKDCSAVQYVIRKGEQGVEIGKDLKDKIKNYILSTNDPILQAMPEGAAVACLHDELTKMIPAAGNHVVLRQKAANPEHRELLNAYTLGETVKKKVITKPQDTVVSVNKEHILAAITQGAKDVVALNIRDVIGPNMCRLSAIVGTKLRKLGGVFLGGRTLLCPLHFIDGLVDGDIINIMCGELNIRESFCESRYVRVDQLDAVVYEVGMRMPFKRNIIHHFLTEKDYEQVTKTLATLHVLQESMESVAWMTTAVIGPGVMYEDNKCKNFKYDNVRTWGYEVATRNGDCGAVLLANNNNLQRKILGIHIAGLPGSDAGFALGLSREQLEQAMSRVEKANRVVEVNVEPMCYMETGPPTMLPVGNFTIYGKAKPKFIAKLAEKTEIRKSPIHGLVREPVTEPAILTPKDYRWVWDDTPLIRGVSKYGVITTPFRNKDIEHAKEFIMSEIAGWKKVMEPRVLTDYESVFGNELIPYFERMNMASSPGYPFILNRPSGERGKAYLYDVASEDGIADQQYREIFRARELLAKAGIRGAHVWVACLKDERRPMAKIQAGKTRVFTIGSADFTQLMRKYFMAFNVNFYANHVKFFSAVGIDPYSYSWTQLWRRINKKGSFGFGADYSNFDGIVDPDLVKAFGDIVNEHYGDEPEENKRVRDVLLEECIHSVILMYSTFLNKHTGNPSGNPETTPLNTVVNYFYVLLAWIEIMRRYMPAYMVLEYFRSFVSVIFYGDDGCVGVHRLVQEVFNLREVSRVLEAHGIKYTDESKGIELYTVKPLTECTFLKNGFVKMKGRNIMLAPIAEDTIFELTNWVRTSDDDVFQLRENLLDVFKFAFHHGEEFFDLLKENVNRALVQRGLRRFPATYSHLREEFLDACSY